MCMFPSLSSLHTSKRMHFIEEARVCTVEGSGACKDAP